MNEQTSPSQPTKPSDFRRKVLQRIEGFICKDRQNAYGDAEDNFQNIGEFWTLWLTKRGLLVNGATITRLDVCVLMSLMKDCRKLGNLQYQDNWDDATGYQAIGAAMVERDNSILQLLTKHIGQDTPEETSK
jgi:hypothetical protein